MKESFCCIKAFRKEIRYCEGERDSYFYFASLSAKTIVYKGMLTPDQVTRFYLDLMDLDMTTAIALVHSRFSTNTFLVGKEHILTDTLSTMAKLTLLEVM